MIIRLGTHEFDDVVYDADGDVLYLHNIETSASDLAPALAA
jgi:hypothetical protein